MDLRTPLITLALCAVPLAGHGAQAPGFAEITRPGSGEAVRGVVTLEGTANHPSFDHFDLAFTYEGDTTGTWFAIVDEDRSRVVEGKLAVWDTTGITDGDYRLRLRVWPSQGEPLEAVVRNIRVRNYNPIETPTPRPDTTSAAVATSTPPPMPTSTLSPPVLPAPAVEPASRVGRALLSGGLAAVALLTGVGIYATWRAHSRANWGSPRSTRRAERRRRSRRPS